MAAIQNNISQDTAPSCDICGEEHPSNDCQYLRITSHVKDNDVPTRARLTIPSILRIETMSEGSFSIVASSDIKKGTEFGPFEARQMFTMNPGINFPLKLFVLNNYFSEYYLDATNEHECNWMMFVEPAANPEEQNMICYQRDCQVYYATTRNVTSGEFLKVWYSPAYAKMMNKTLLTSEVEQQKVLFDLDKLLKEQQNLIEKDIWTCKFCNVQEVDVTKFATHISDHYSLQLRKACHICKAMFTTNTALKKHLHVVHTPVPMIKKKDVNDSRSDTKNIMKDSMLGGPLLNDILTDSMDNTNLLLQQAELTAFDMQNIDNQSMLLDGDSLNLGMENLIAANDHFNFDIDDDKEQYTCDICMKPFTKLKQLVQHLQMHTGKYTCPECLIIFSRNENLRAHRCNVTADMQHSCPQCGKIFPLKKYLSRHMQTVHGNKFQCDDCKRHYKSEKTLREHNCPKISENDKEKFPCLICDKVFFRESYMKRHMKTHSTKKEPVDDKVFICEICAKHFDTARNLQRHMSFHRSSKSVGCNQCDKRFTREESLASHFSQHHANDEFSCDICPKKFKSRKYLITHKSTHKKRRKYACDHCTRMFFLRANLLRHMRSKHNNGTSLENILVEYYRCPFCTNTVKLRGSLVRHIRKHHPGENYDLKNISASMGNIKKTDVETFNNNSDIDLDGLCLETTKEIDTDIEINADYEVIAQQFEEFEKENLPDNDNSEKPEEPILDFNSIDIDLAAGLVMPEERNVNNQEVCLSMPELDNEVEQNITLGDKAFILDNGTIVEPLDQGNYVVYVLDKQLT